MKNFISTEIFEKFPDFIRFVVVARGVDNSKEDAGLSKMLTEITQEVRKNKDLDSPTSHPLIKNWREAFFKLGIDPDLFMPAVQALVVRAKRPDMEEGKPIFAYHNTLVALSNYISLKYLVPSGVDDLGLVEGDFGLRLAKGNEIFVGFASNRIEYPEPGEIILADKRKAMCRRWVWQQGVHTSATHYTKDAAVNIDILPPLTEEQGTKIAKEIAGMVQNCTGAKVEIFKLDKANPTIDYETPPFTMETSVYDTLEMRGYIQQTSDRAEVRRLINEGTTIYQGFDPTKPSLHVGHLMSLIVHHYLQEVGNSMIFILGGGTAQVGDPSARAKGRKMITTEEVAENAKGVKAQVQKMGLINFTPGAASKEKPVARLLDNSEWLHMDLLEFAREVTPHFSVNTMVKREDFKKRLDENVSLTLFEFIYTALQGYDYLYLYEKYGCRIQMGGNDQWMNILDGMDLIGRKTGASAFALTFPLLMDRAGQKMGKTSEGGAVWLAAEGEYSMSPFEFYQYWVNCPDEDLERNFKLFTFLPLDEIDQILTGHPRQAQHRLAFEVTKIVHGEEIAKNVQSDAMRSFGAAEGIPEDVPTVTLTQAEAETGKSLINILTEVGIKSRSDARRLIQQGGVVLNETRLGEKDTMRLIKGNDLKDISGQKVAIIRFGKGKIAKIVLG